MGSVTIGDQLKPVNANLEQQLDLPTRVTVAANCIQTEKPHLIIHLHDQICQSRLKVTVCSCKF